MHQSVLRLRSCCQLRLHCYLCNIHVRRSSSAGTVPVANSDQRATEALEPWQDSGGKALARSEKDAKDIFVDDLSATLEAHRASNRAAVIRKVNVTAVVAPPRFQRLLLERDGNDGSEFNETHEEEKKNIRSQMWPADSVQAKDMKRKRGNRRFEKKNEASEYTAVAHTPQGPWRIRIPFEGIQIQRPWLAYVETTGEDKLQNLTNEIKAYEAYMRLSPREEAAAQLVISDVNSVMRQKSAVKPLTLLGSRSTGLATPISDFDFTFALPHSLPGGWKIPPSEDSVSHAEPPNSEIKQKARKALAKMVPYFHSSSKFGDTEFVRFARVPIIRSKHVATGLDVQIQTMAPYQAAHEHTIAYLSEFPSLRPLYILLRYCLELRNLTTVFEGGLGSYSILVMIVTALKHSSGRFASDDLGGQLMYVLEFYGKANLYEVGFSANPPRVFEKQKKGWSLEERNVRFTDPQLSGIDRMTTFYPRKPYLLCLQDPANDLNDLGKNAYAIKHIQATFCGLRESIEKRMKNPTVKDSDGSTLSYLERLVSADYRHFESGRSRVERFADPKKRNDRDYSDESILKQYEERLNWYKGTAERHRNRPEPASKVIDKNAAKSVETGGSSSAGPRFAPAWYSQDLTRTRDGTIRIKQSDAEEQQADEEKTLIPAQEKQEQSQIRQETDNDNYGWHPSSPTHAKPLLEALAARAPEPQTQNQRPKKPPPSESPPRRPPVLLSWYSEPDGPPLRSLGTLTAAQDEAAGPDPYADVEELGLGSDVSAMYKERVKSWHLAQKLGSDGAILPRRRRGEGKEGEKEKEKDKEKEKEKEEESSAIS